VTVVKRHSSHGGPGVLEDFWVRTRGPAFQQRRVSSMGRRKLRGWGCAGWDRRHGQWQKHDGSGKADKKKPLETGLVQKETSRRVGRKIRQKRRTNMGVGWGGGKVSEGTSRKDAPKNIQKRGQRSPRWPERAARLLGLPLSYPFPRKGRRT